jgi:hypothetical protein
MSVPMICPQEITDEIIELLETHPSERNIIQYHIHRLIIRSCVTGENMVESLRQFVSRGGVPKDENPGLTLEYLASLGDRGFSGSNAGDLLFADMVAVKAGMICDAYWGESIARLEYLTRGLGSWNTSGDLGGNLRKALKNIAQDPRAM